MPHKDLLEYGIIKHVIKFNVKQKKMFIQIVNV